MAFKFSFEKLLEYQKQQEDVARRDYNESLERLESEKEKYQSIFKVQDQALDEIFFLQNRKEGAPISRLVSIGQFVEGQKRRIELQREIVINHTTIVEQKQEILHVAAKERKILEKLKEKKQLEYKTQMKKKEAKENDELVVTRHKGRL